VKFEPGKKHLFLDISSTNIDTLVPMRRNPQHRSLLTAVSDTSTPGRASSAAFERPWENLSTRCEPLYATNTSHFKQETFLYQHPWHWVIFPKTLNTTLFFGSTPSSTSPFWLLKPDSDHAHARLLPRLSWSWTVLLPSDTHIKSITYITAVFIPFVIYLLTLPRI
jgi:hypothetical protein